MVIGVTTLSAAVPSFVASIILLVRVRREPRLVPGARHGRRCCSTSCSTSPCRPSRCAFSSIALVARITRSAVREELGREHVQTAVSRGIPYSLVVRRHVHAQRCHPDHHRRGHHGRVLFAASAVVERAFALNGIGSYLIQGRVSKDIAVVQGISLVIVAVFVVVNAIVDFLYAVLDPRVSLGPKAS